MSKITQEFLKEKLDYNPETGIFIWKTGNLKGKIAGSKTPLNYLNIFLNGKIYKAHRLVFLYMNGELPPQDKVVDHKNSIRDDNRFENLRIVTRLENNLFRKSPEDNYISYDKQKQKWAVRFNKFLKYCNSKKDAQDYFKEFLINNPNFKGVETKKIKITHNYLRENYTYENGKLINNKTTKIIGCKQRDYIGTYLKGICYLVHRLIFLYFNSNFDIYDKNISIDHINGIKSDNRIENLRIVTRNQNAANRTIKKRRYLRGVCKRSNKFESIIGFNNKIKSLGFYETEQEAHEAYKNKHLELFGEYSFFNRI